MSSGLKVVINPLCPLVFLFLMSLLPLPPPEFKGEGGPVGPAGPGGARGAPVSSYLLYLPCAHTCQHLTSPCYKLLPSVGIVFIIHKQNLTTCYGSKLSVLSEVSCSWNS